MEKRIAAQRRQWESSMNASTDSNSKRLLRTPSDADNGVTDVHILPEKFKPANGTQLPERYAIKTSGKERVLTCLETPNLNVHIETGLTFSGSVARKSPPGTIFLDGVAQCEPFMDHERQVYNLDHHEGCVRAFTLATCEQALVMYMKGLDLRTREWNIFANEPDLDTLLAVWILLNHTRIGRQDSTQRRLLFALVRYEGVIDALGLELKELCALPETMMIKIQRVIDHLRTSELAIKKEGTWGETDYLAYTAAALTKIDQIFYKPSDFVDYQGMEELARIDLSDQRIAAVVEADMGIYEIEPHLNKLYGDRLGVVFLKKGANTYTVRQMDLFMPLTLETIYERLNFVDAAVKFRTQSNKWGGATDIGGSPRDSGTYLSPFEIVHACREAVAKPDRVQRLYRFGVVAALMVLIVLCAHLVRRIWAPEIWFSQFPAEVLWAAPDFGFILTLLIAAGVSLIVVARGHAWQYGWSAPIGNQWWLLLPLAIVGGWLGGTWVPEALDDSRQWQSLILLGLVAMPLAAESLFRGLAHGLLAQSCRIQRNDSRWFLSWPILGSTVLYVGFIATLALSDPVETASVDWSQISQVLVGALLVGLSLGWVRERAQSLLPAVLLHALASAAAILIPSLW